MRMHIWGALALCALLFSGSAASAQQAPPKAAGTPAVAARPAVNLNTATLDQLETLPGVGRATAERIVEYRQKNGAFKKVEELMNIRGIGEKSFLKLRPMVFVPQKNDKGGGGR